MQEHAKSEGRDGMLARDVLGLQDGETESSLDERLKSEAQALGIHIEAPVQPRQETPRAKSLSSDLHRTSMDSGGSKASRSTGFTSTFSDASREYARLHIDGISCTSLSSKENDTTGARGVPNDRQSTSFSPPTTPSQSIMSLPLSSPEASPRRHFRRIRGFSMLKLHRTDSSSSLSEHCPHCPRDLQSQRRAAHKLPCGHKLCTQALRDRIVTATQGNFCTVPTCCGVPIPGKLAEYVLKQTQHSALMDKLEPSDKVSSIAISVVTEPKPSTTSLPHSREDPKAPEDTALSSEARKDLERITGDPSFVDLRRQQFDVRDRFLSWINTQHASLQVQQDLLRSTLKARHETETEDVLERHGAAISEVEDRQVKAEADMRTLHSQERRDSATALKHMEAYCAGTLHSTGESHGRTVTEPERAELEKARRVREQMDAKHESAINILRGEQGRRIRLRAQRQEKEVQELRRVQRKEELELERACTQAVHDLERSVADQRLRLENRCRLQSAIFVKRFEQETGTIVRASLPDVDWEAEKYDETSAGAEETDSRQHGIATSLTMAR